MVVVKLKMILSGRIAFGVMVNMAQRVVVMVKTRPVVVVDIGVQLVDMTRMGMAVLQVVVQGT